METSFLRARRAGIETNSGGNGTLNRSMAEVAAGREDLLLAADPDFFTIHSNASISDILHPNTPRLEVVPTYNGLPMTAKDIFAIALSTMVLSAEQGPKTQCVGITGDGFDMVPIFDAYGQSLLKYHSLIRAMRILTRWMAWMKRFEEIDIKLLRDDTVIGIGRLKRFEQDEAAR